ncbi:hypothetical protein [Haloferax profundi]|uniref:DUF7982 domain-containing protein n=1 Tax=Haloferax profundi TaxID=1544718 RepID=A0A0W1RC07_9EURY|nr:hypothetical protein [Haloferax profundi]KTG11075.1 hypothetical protein AUR66_20115 [Haloferax profundi]
MSNQNALDRETDTTQSSEEEDLAALRGEVELLREENQQLRNEYLRARQATYRKSAVGLFGLGLLALTGAVIFPAVRTVLLVLAGTGGFAGVLLFYLTPDQLVPVTVGEAIYDAYATLGEQLKSELGLQDVSVYTPVSKTGSSTVGVRLFIPQPAEWKLPKNNLSTLFVATGDAERRGVGITPSSARLYREFKQSVTGELQSNPSELTQQLTDGVIEQFELVQAASSEVDAENGRITVRVTAPSYGNPSAFDHPVVSFFGVGLADTLDNPVLLRTVVADGDEFVISFETEEQV